jgi:hypothetical protein
VKQHSACGVGAWPTPSRGRGSRGFRPAQIQSGDAYFLSARGRRAAPARPGQRRCRKGAAAGGELLAMLRVGMRRVLWLVSEEVESLMHASNLIPNPFSPQPYTLNPRRYTLDLKP